MSGRLSSGTSFGGSGRLPYDDSASPLGNACAPTPKGKSGFVSKIWSGFRFMLHGHEKSFTVNPVEAAEYARGRFAALLREPFPGESDKAVARYWAPKLGRSERTIENWLAGTTSASIEDLVAVVAMHGIWDATRIFLGDATRNEVLKKIGR